MAGQGNRNRKNGMSTNATWSKSKVDLVPLTQDRFNKMTPSQKAAYGPYLDGNYDPLTGETLPPTALGSATPSKTAEWAKNYTDKKNAWIRGEKIAPPNPAGDTGPTVNGTNITTNSGKESDMRALLQQYGNPNNQSPEQQSLGEWGHNQSLVNASFPVANSLSDATKENTLKGQLATDSPASVGFAPNPGTVGNLTNPTVNRDTANAKIQPFIANKFAPDKGTGAGNKAMQPSSAVVSKMEEGVQPANLNGFDGNVPNESNDWANSKKIPTSDSVADKLQNEADTLAMNWMNRTKESNDPTRPGSQTRSKVASSVVRNLI